jgi:hypothetical protein
VEGVKGLVVAAMEVVVLFAKAIFLSSSFFAVVSTLT